MKFAAIKEKISRIINYLIQGTYNHYACYLPGRIGFISDSILRLFFSGITVNKEQTDFLKDLKEKGTVIYASKYKSSFDFLFFYTRYKKDGLPYPEIGFDYKIFVWQPILRIFRMVLSHFSHFFKKWHLPNPYESRYIQDELSRSRTAFLSLVEPRGFHRRFVKQKTDPVRYIIESQQIMEHPIYIVPQWIIFSRNPGRSQRGIVDILFGTESNPGNLRRLFRLFRHPEKVFVEIADPFNVKRFIQRPENQNRSIEHLSFLLRKELTERLDRHRHSIIGPNIKNREELKEVILRDEKLRHFMLHFAKSRKEPLHSVYREAASYVDEIAANYNNGLIQILSAIVGWMFNNMFDGVNIDRKGLAKLRQASQKSPLVLIPCHKSHIDYLILSYVLYNNNMPVPHIAAGKNLSFWPMGPIFRNSGAFFIRRTFQGAVLYSKIFAEYISTLLKEGFNIEFFIEGGRSRTGKLILPKLGLLSILINSCREGACSDLTFIPIFIGYDRVLEEKAYLKEIEGGEKESENLSQVIKARRFLKKRYGRIYIEFNDPISLRDVAATFDTPFEEMKNKDHNILCRNLGHRIINAINQVSIVTPHALVAAALLNGTVKGFMKSELAARMESYLNYIVFENAKLSDTMINYVQSVEEVLNTYMGRKFVEKMAVSTVKEALGDIRLAVNESKRPFLEYYKNNCIHFFIPAAYTALAILSRDAFQFSEDDLQADYEFLQEFFKNEFAFDVEKTSRDYISRCLKAFVSDAIIIPHPQIHEAYNVTSVGFRKLRDFAAFLKTYFESYWVVLNVFMENEQENLDQKVRVKKMRNLGNRMYKNNEIIHEEALSEINFKNAAEYFNYHGIKGKGNNKEIEYYSTQMQKYMK